VVSGSIASSYKTVLPERRKTFRFRAAAPIVVQSVDTKVAMTLLDLGGGGFSLQTPVRFEIGLVMRFRFSTPDGTWSTLLSAETVYCRPDGDAVPGAGYVVGFKYQNPEIPRIAENLNALIDRATAEISFS